MNESFIFIPDRDSMNHMVTTKETLHILLTPVSQIIVLEFNSFCARDKDEFYLAVFTGWEDEMV